MAVEQMASLAGKLGGRLSAANAAAKDQPVDTGFQRLPSGIKNGVAKLQVMEWKVQEKDGGQTPKGEMQMRAAAVVLFPTHHGTEKILSRQTSQFISLCDLSAGKPPSERKAKSFDDNYFDFQNLFRLLGIPPCPETGASDPNGVKTEAYWRAAIQRLTDPKNPTYISFSTRGWTPKKLPGATKEPEEMVFEDWNGLADPELLKTVLQGTAPGQGVTVRDPATSQPPPHTLPPSTNGAGAVVAVSTSAPTTGPADDDEIASLVEVAMGDPQGKTPDGKAAQVRLEDLAFQAGWSREQTANAKDWADVGDMAMTPYTDDDSRAQIENEGSGSVVVGSKWLFTKRKQDGSKLTNNRNEPLAPQEVEVLTVDEAAQTCTVKFTRDGKPHVNARDKQPVNVKFEWLESF